MKRTGMLIAAAALASCWKSGGTTQEPKVVVGDVTVELSSVNLGDDCGEDAASADEPDHGSMHKSSVANRKASAGASISTADIGCVPTAMQLALRGSGTGETSLRVKKVVLVDSHGTVIGNLTPRAPTRWADGAYIAWNQKVRGGETLQASYTLRGLDWNKVPGGRWDAQERTFTLRVTLEVGSGERTVEKTASMPKISIEAPAVT